MEQSTMDRRIYALAREYLLGIERVTPQMLERHLSPTQDRSNTTLAGIYRQLLESAQNAQMGRNVIGGSIGGIDNLAPLLCGFEPAEIVGQRWGGWEQVLDEIVEKLKPRGQIRRTPKSLWPRFCRTILSGAAFLARFDKSDDFYAWVDFFDQDDRARASLPMLLDHEIDGLGFPLACDFLKELGYVNFGKPDVHLKKIFATLRLSPREDDYEVFKAIVRVARNVGVTPYNVDKVFWLIGSGNFYLDEVEVGRHREDFIAHAQARGDAGL